MTDEQQEEGMALTTEDHAAATGHPHAGISSEGFSSPQGDIATPMACFAKLVLKRSGAITDIEFPLNPPSTVGRFDPAVGPIDVDLGSLPEGSYVSRKHARITCSDGVWEVHDLGSSNGTFVLNDDFDRVNEPTALHDGQEVAFGNARFIFHTTVAETAMSPN